MLLLSRGYGLLNPLAGVQHEHHLYCHAQPHG
jgi:hypothetical protein